MRWIRHTLLRLRTGSASLRGRFVVHVLLLLCVLSCFTLLLITRFGILDSADGKLERTLNHQLESSFAAVETTMDRLAAHAVNLSEQMTVLLRRSLDESGLGFEELRNNPQALAALQSDAYPLVHNAMRSAPCSGAFYILDTTVNDASDRTSYNGLYLKVVNLFADSAIRNRVCLYRGAAVTARKNTIGLHSMWDNETSAGSFPEIDALLHCSVKSLPQTYLLTSVYRLPDTWERARFLCVPILDDVGKTVGVCGFEISDLFFKLANRTNNEEQGRLVCVLLSRNGTRYVGQISGSRSGYVPPVREAFSLETESRFAVIRSGDLSFYGKVRPVTIGVSSHLLAIMLPEAEYRAVLREERMKAAAALGLVAAAALCACLWLSRRYVVPFIRGVEQLKADSATWRPSCVPEINELQSVLARRELERNRELHRLGREIEDVKGECEKAQTEASRLAYLRNREIDPDDFLRFEDGLSRLTRTERVIFDLYLKGKTTQEVLEAAGIRQNTLKFHNKNIYGKLGVSSRRQLLRYAALHRRQTVQGD